MLHNSQSPVLRTLETISKAPQDTHFHLCCSLTHAHYSHTDPCLRIVPSFLSLTPQLLPAVPEPRSLLSTSVSHTPEHGQHTGASGVLPQPYKPHQNRPLEKSPKSDTKIEIISPWKWSPFLGVIGQWLSEAFTLVNKNRASSSLLRPKALPIC